MATTTMTMMTSKLLERTNQSKNESKSIKLQHSQHSLART